MREFLHLIATEPEIARVPVMIDSSKWPVIEAGLQAIQGKAHRQLDQPEGRRSRLPAQGPAHPPLRRRRRGDGVRRERPGRHRRAQGADPAAGLRPADARGRVRSDRHRARSQRAGHRHGPRGARELRRELHRGHAHPQGDLPGRARERRDLEPVVRVPRQRRRARGDPLGVPLPRHPGGPRHGHRQCRPAGGVRGHRAGAARAGRRPDLQPPAGRHRAPRRVRGDGEGRRRAPRRRPRLAAGHGGGAPGARPGARRGGLHRAGHRGSPRRAGRSP